VPNDQKDVEQPAILLGYVGDGAFKTVNNVHIPEVPHGCESQQLFDWAVLHHLFSTDNMNHALRMRVVEAYCERWLVPTEEWGGPWPPPPPEER
jgi:hypothetical protein